jgi:hypothetical protein
MSEYSRPTEPHVHHVVSPISVVWVVLASLLCAAGLLSLFWGLMILSWPFFVVGPLLVFAGTLMLLNRRAGLDHA